MSAPALISVMRPAAPARHIVSKFIPVLQLPPVTAAPRIGSLYFGSLEASAIDMSFQDASSSSATSCAMVLEICWPISALPTVTTTLPSWPIEYQTDGSKLALVAANASLIAGAPT
jgi:hypothetical protein